jgi:hypothetical protein
VTTIIEPDIIVPLTRDDAERLDGEIRGLVKVTHTSIAMLYERVEEAKRGNIHAVFGFPSWTAYLADVFTVPVRLGPAQRREMVGYLSGEGMSQRAIADVVGADRKTVRKDLDEQVGETGPPVTGRDGKTYKRKPAPEPSPAAPTPRPHKGRGNAKKQLNAANGIAPQIAGVATALEAVFTGGFEKSFTPETAADFAKQLKIEVGRINKVIREIEHYGKDLDNNVSQKPMLANEIQRLSASIAPSCDLLTDEEIAEALGAGQFLYELLRGETIIRANKKGCNVDLGRSVTSAPALDKWDESAWDAEKLTIPSSSSK